MEDSVIIKKISKEPYTPTELARLFGKHHYTMEEYMRRLRERDPRVKVKTIGRATIYWAAEESFEELRDYVKETVGKKTHRDTILLKLLEAGAFSPKIAIDAKLFGGMKAELSDLVVAQRVILTPNGKVYLTELGKGIAEGAALIYSE